MPAYSVKCATNQCPSAYRSTHYDSAEQFRDAIARQGWVREADAWTCPECNEEPETALILPLPCGTFHAIIPDSMTGEDWLALADAINAIARRMADGTRQNLPTPRGVPG